MVQTWLFTWRGQTSVINTWTVLKFTSHTYRFLTYFPDSFSTSALNMQATGNADGCLLGPSSSLMIRCPVNSFRTSRATQRPTSNGICSFLPFVHCQRSLASVYKNSSHIPMKLTHLKKLASWPQRQLGLLKFLAII